MNNTILLVDADGDCEEAVSIAGSMHGYRTHWVYSSRDAFEALDRNLSRPRLIVVDVDPGTHSLILLEAIGSCEHRPPIVVITGLEEGSMIPVARKHGATDCLGKPINRKRLAQAIGKISARRRLSSDRGEHSTSFSNPSNGREIKQAARGISAKLRS